MKKKEEEEEEDQPPREIREKLTERADRVSCGASGIAFSSNPRRGWLAGMNRFFNGILTKSLVQ